MTEKSPQSKRAQTLARKRAASKTGLATKRERIEAQQRWAAQPGAIEELCAFIAESGTLLHYSNASGGVLSYSFLYAWVHADERRKALYREAQEARYASKLEEVIELADRVKEERSAIEKAKLQVGTRQWMASRLLPQYKDKVEINTTAQPLSEKTDAELDKALAEVAARLKGLQGDD